MKTPRFPGWVRPGQSLPEADERARQSRRADGLLPLLGLLLLLAGLAQHLPH